MVHRRVVVSVRGLFAIVGVPVLSVSSIGAQEHVGGIEALPTGFVDEMVIFDIAPNTIGFRVLAEDDIVVWEKAGRVRRWFDGAWLPTPLADITEEVADWNDHGLVDVALDPDYARNGLVYLYYAVDRHHLDHYGTPEYDPQTNEFAVETIGRITRYAVFDPSDPATTIDPATRTILVGEDAGSGIPICSPSHGLGRLVFGHDGSLLFSCGDSFNGPVFQQECLAAGIFDPKEDLRFFRSQLVDAPNGKIHRIDPATGDGLPSNPFFDPAEPGSWRSRVWGMGLRNPFRFAVGPDEDSHAEHPTGPGNLYVGDVGRALWEELSVVTEGGQNLGWPVWEGYELTLFPDEENPDAPNPLGGAGCGAFFEFEDLLVEDSLNAPSWPNPCDPGQQVPASIPTFVHRRPAIVWGQADAFPAPTARVKTYDVGGEATFVDIEDPDSPVTGAPFHGNASIGGVWFEGSTFPAPFRDVYFHADFGEGWIRAFAFDDEDVLQAVHELTDSAGPVTQIRTDPRGEALYYLRYRQGRAIRRVVYAANAAPVADVVASPGYGPSPLRVELSASGSSDPEGGPLQFEWDFGEGEPWTPLHAWPDTVHVYPSRDVTHTATAVLQPSATFRSRDEPFVSALQGPSVLADGAYPPVGSTDAGAQVRVEQPNPWIGYELLRPRDLVALIFQEGVATGPEGGWLASPVVEVRDGAGTWVPVGGLVVTPAPPGDPGLGFETFHLSFDTVRASAIRVREGAPGAGPGSLTAAELRVIALPPEGPAGPFREVRPGLARTTAGAAAAGQRTTGPAAASHVATVRVTDDFEVTSEASALVSTDNTPPIVTMLSPVPGQTYPVGAPSEVFLQAVVEDAEHDASSLACEWILELVHENHTHPEPPDPRCSLSFTLVPHEELMGDTVYWRFTLEVTDPHGLRTSVMRRVVPEGDCNLNGVEDSLDLAAGTSHDFNGNGVPDECEGGLDFGRLGEVRLGVPRRR